METVNKGILTSHIRGLIKGWQDEDGDTIAMLDGELVVRVMKRVIKEIEDGHFDMEMCEDE